jgi:hypothetical protein
VSCCVDVYSATNINRVPSPTAATADADAAVTTYFSFVGHASAAVCLDADGMVGPVQVSPSSIISACCQRWTWHCHGKLLLTRLLSSANSVTVSSMYV